MRMSMTLNFALLLAMVATNILSFYHLSTNLYSQSPFVPPPVVQVPDQLVQQLSNIRASIAHLTRHQSPSVHSSNSASIPPDLLLYSTLSPIASSCHNHPDLLNEYMSYTPFTLCPSNSNRLAEDLILRGCHPLPRRRCFSRTPRKLPSSFPFNPFPSSLPDSNIIWDNYPSCNSFSCPSLQDPSSGFQMKTEISQFMKYNTNLDLPIPQLIQISKSSNSTLRLGLDIGGKTGTLAARMKLYNVTVITTTLNLNLPNSEVVATRGLIPLHVPLQQRLPIFDGVLDLVHCGRAVNRWIPLVMLEFLLFDVDRVLRGGGYLWLDHFFCKEEDLDKVYAPLINKLGYKAVKWNVAKKTVSNGKVKDGDVYLTALLQKPASK